MSALLPSSDRKIGKKLGSGESPTPFFYAVTPIIGGMTGAETVANQAAHLLDAGAVEAAVRLVSDAARRGDPHALNELALWHVYGSPLRRDFGLARLFFGRAGEAGHKAAAITHAVFVALGAGAEPDWRAALGLLRAAADRDPLAARQLAIIDGMDIDENGRPLSLPAITQRAMSPDVQQFRALLSSDECAHVMALAEPLLIPSIVIDSRTGRQSPNPVRTSFGAVLGPIQQDLVVHALNLRIAAATRTNIDHGEPLVVLRYRPGQQYREHHDGLPGEQNQRHRTMIAYLNDGYGGGETTFAAAGLAIRGSVGDAISFANTFPDGRIDERSRHAGQPVQYGSKWICTRWIRMRNFDPWGLRTPSLR
ncbi:MAG: 2OG-Fe(II) oxygenase [Sphingopyxis sp.]|nr:2OG-Fe(II) oxygenase [Sphingopyxis sp.]